MANLLKILLQGQVAATDSAPGRMLICATDHPNKLSFEGVLVRLDEPSTKPPGGAQGHLIQVPRDLAQQKLGTLLLMGVNYDDSLDAHAPDKKVGVITKAWIKGNALYVAGHVWAQDFPDARKILAMAGMGMSMELANVRVENPDARVWVLTDFTFTGATFLRRSSAAYFHTSAIAAAADDATRIYLNTEAEMPNTATVVARKGNKKPAVTDEQKALARITAASVASTVSTTLTPTLAAIAAAMETNGRTNAAILAKLNAGGDGDEDEDVTAADAAAAAAISAGGEGGEGADATGTVTAGKKKNNSGDDNADWNGDEEDDDEDDVNAASTPGPGHINEDSHNRGGSAELEDTQGPVKAAYEARIEAAKAKIAKWKTRAVQAQARAVTVEQQLSAANTTINELRQVRTVQAGVIKDRSAEVTRKTLAAADIRLLEKSGMDAVELKAAGQKLSAADADAVLRLGSPNMSPEDRIAAKLRFQASGLMETPQPRRVQQ